MFSKLSSHRHLLRLPFYSGSSILKEYILDEHLRRHKGELARKRAMERFSEDVVVTDIINMYDEILNR